MLAVSLKPLIHKLKTPKLQPLMLKYMLDTDIVSYTMKNKPASVRAAFKKYDGRMCISSITYMKLVYGAERSSKSKHSLTILEGIAARMEVLHLGDSAALHSGHIRAEFAKLGTPIEPMPN